MSLLLLVLAACSPDPCKEGDADADGYCADVDCDDADATVHTLTAWYVDGDGDGFGDPSARQSYCHDPGAGWVRTPADCDDEAQAVNPGADEVCNGVDDDCSGEIDDITEGTLWYPDGDDDGYGTTNGERLACEQPPGYAAADGDCDDDDATTYPGARDVWDGADNDCDGVTDAMTLEVGDLGGEAAFARLRGTEALPIGGIDTLGGGADLTGDDAIELAVGSPTAAGAVWLTDRAALTGDDLVVAVATSTFVGASGDALGAVPWQLGDLVSDGGIDLPLSSCSAGRVDLFAGPVAGAPSTLDAWATVDVRDPGRACLTAFATVHGSPTLVVADPEGVRGGCEAHNGSVYLFEGGVDEGWAWAWNGGTEAVGPSWEIDGSQTTCVDGGERLGTALVVADVDHDGDDELILGAPGATDGTEAVGIVYVARPAADADPRKSEQVGVIRLTGDEGAPLGAAGTIARPADLDGDGVDELVFSSPVAERVYVWSWEEGAIRVVAEESATILRVPGAEAPTGTGFGAAVATADLDGSGLADVVVGAPGDGERGAVWVYADGFYPPEGEAEPTAILYGPGEGEAFGAALAAVGDLDGNGTDDLLVGAPGCCSAADSGGTEAGGAVYVLTGPLGWWGAE